MVVVTTQGLKAVHWRDFELSHLHLAERDFPRFREN
jgi:hypothetical protein